MATLYGVIIGFSILVAVRAGKSLRCLNCDAVADPRLCRHVTTCFDDEKCGMETYISSDGNLNYRLGCFHINTCAVASTPVPTGSGLSLFYSCHDCCDHEDLCNVRGCNITGYPAARGPVCFNCEDYPLDYPCHRIEVCELHEVCYNNARIDFETKRVYSSGCVSKHNCGSSQLDPMSLVGRKRSTHLCSDCCSGDLCNLECELALSCKDDPTCPLLMASYDICKNTPVAEKLCPRSCNLCPSTTGPTTIGPTTTGPTTIGPTTIGPTTIGPTTTGPTTIGPTTIGPTTIRPTTHAPTTHAPTTHAPTTHAPTTHKLPTQSATTHGLTTQSSTTHRATTHTPTTHGPTTKTAPTYRPTTHGPTTLVTATPAAFPSTAGTPGITITSTAASSTQPTKVCSLALTSLVKVGTKVVRGPDWKWYDQDGHGEGVVVELGITPGWLNVTWANTNITNVYRNGYNGSCDLVPVGFTLPTVPTAATAAAVTTTTAPAIQLGDLVVRGPDWNYGEQDKHGVGTVLAVDKPVSGFVSVAWIQNNASNVYRYGYGGKYDVKLYAGTSPTKPTPTASTTTVIPTYGPELAKLMYVGARVVRGKDWQWEEQDSQGMGDVIEVPPTAPNGWVRVRWDNGTANLYRMGAEGAYDLMFVPGSYHPPSGK